MTEETLVKLFSEVLNIKEDQKIGVKDNFFELGGNSLLSVKMVEKINQLTDAKISISEFFRFPTPALLSQYIENQRQTLKKQISKQSSVQQLPNLESSQRAKIVFPELFHLNEINQSHPIFWIHAGLGGVYPYTALEGKNHIVLFNSIQARAYQTKYAPLQGIQAMASYYVQIIQSDSV